MDRSMRLFAISRAIQILVWLVLAISALPANASGMELWGGEPGVIYPSGRLETKAGMIWWRDRLGTSDENRKNCFNPSPYPEYSGMEDVPAVDADFLDQYLDNYDDDSPTILEIHLLIERIGEQILTPCLLTYLEAKARTAKANGSEPLEGFHNFADRLDLMQYRSSFFPAYKDAVGNRPLTLKLLKQLSNSTIVTMTRDWLQIDQYDEGELSWSSAFEIMGYADFDGDGAGDYIGRFYEIAHKGTHRSNGIVLIRDDPRDGSATYELVLSWMKRTDRRMAEIDAKN